MSPEARDVVLHVLIWTLKFLPLFMMLSESHREAVRHCSALNDLRNAIVRGHMVVLLRGFILSTSEFAEGVEDLYFTVLGSAYLGLRLTVSVGVYLRILR